MLFRSITDVSTLGQVHNLNLSECTGITDVRALKQVLTLILSGCNNIKRGCGRGLMRTNKKRLNVFMQPDGTYKICL